MGTSLTMLATLALVTVLSPDPTSLLAPVFVAIDGAVPLAYARASWREAEKRRGSPELRVSIALGAARRCVLSAAGPPPGEHALTSALTLTI